MPEQPLSADFLAPRRRRPRVDPTLLDWKKLTGEENVAVINRETGKKVSYYFENFVINVYYLVRRYYDVVSDKGHISANIN